LFRIYLTLKDHGVKLYFAEEKLDSSDEKFQLALALFGMLDEQYRKRLGEAISQGRRRCVDSK